VCDAPKMTLQVALNYGGRQDIVQAAQSLARRVQSQNLAPEDITTQTFAQHLWSGKTPSPDLLIRTSGETRLSNYLLWSLAYTELYFTPILWPDFSVEEYKKAIAWLQNKHRRFGGNG